MFGLQKNRDPERNEDYSFLKDQAMTWEMLCLDQIFSEKKTARAPSCR